MRATTERIANLKDIIRKLQKRASAAKLSAENSKGEIARAEARGREREARAAIRELLGRLTR